MSTADILMLAPMTTSAIIVGMAKHPAFIEHLPAKDYEALLPQRLTSDALAEQQVFSLLVRENGRSPDAYRLAINAAELRRAFGIVAFKTILLDGDFRPASQPIDSTIAPDNMWSGKLTITSRGRKFSANSGFIAPYEDVNERSLLDAFETIGASQ